MTFFGRDRCALSSNAADQQKKSPFTLHSCGERGIRTLGTVTRTHAFQACSLSHSDTSPFINKLPDDVAIR